MNPRTEAALDQMHQYLQGEISPPDAADAVATLMAQPPEVMMQLVATWCAGEVRRGRVSIGDLLLGALKKVYITGELGLLDREAVANYLDRATTVALKVCPPEQLKQLRDNLAAMRLMGLAALQPTRLSVPTLQNVPLPMPAAREPEDVAVARRFNLVLDRLQKQARDGGPQAAPADSRTFSQLLTMAASQSANAQQFNDYLKVIQPLAGGKEGNVFVVLGGAMPSWDLGTLAPGQGGPTPAEVGAMEKIIDLAEDATGAMHRLRELILAAVQKFNDGVLSAALWMLSVAEDTITERKLDLAIVDRIRGEAAATINAVQLRKYTENRGKHAALKIVLEFFPTLRLGKVLADLRGEKQADRRRLLLGFAEAYGESGREAALLSLEQELLRDDVDTYYLRNLIYILHRVTVESNQTVPRELQALTTTSAPGQNIYVIKEAATALGFIRNDAAVALLTTRLVEFETRLVRGDKSYPVNEVHKLLDRLTGSLARIGTPAALVAVARHGLTDNPLLGDTRARLTPLAQHDLSFDEGTIDALTAALRDELPGRFLGRLIAKGQEAAVRLIEVLACTRHEMVQLLLQNIAEQFADQDIGRAATAVIEKMAPPKVAPTAEQAATLTGELEFFGLPSLLQSLADMSATGMLTLTNRQRQPVTKLLVLGGKFLNAQTGNIRGRDALFEALERPIMGTFAFVPRPAEKMTSDNEPLDILPLLLEGIRRHDELQRLLVVAPDSMLLTRGETRPTPHPDEEDANLLRDAWIKITTGSTVADAERDLGVDAFRSRRLFAHWLEQGALSAK